MHADFARTAATNLATEGAYGAPLAATRRAPTRRHDRPIWSPPHMAPPIAAEQVKANLTVARGGATCCTGARDPVVPRVSRWSACR